MLNEFFSAGVSLCSVRVDRRILVSQKSIATGSKLRNNASVLRSHG
jgi:hypothetical protein